MKKLLLIIPLLFLGGCAGMSGGLSDQSQDVGAAGVGVTSWTVQTEAISGSDVLPITDVSDTTQSDSGSSKKATFTQVGTYMATLFEDSLVCSEGQVKVWTSGAWACGTGGSSVVNINDLGDVDTAGKAEGKTLKFDAYGNLVVGDDNTADAGSVVAADVSITDTGDYWSTANVDSVLQEVGSALEGKADTADIQNVGDNIRTFLLGGALKTTQIVAGAFNISVASSSRSLTSDDYTGGVVVVSDDAVLTFPSVTFGLGGKIMADANSNPTITTTPQTGNIFKIGDELGAAGASFTCTGGDCQMVYLGIDLYHWDVQLKGPWLEVE